MKSLVCEYCGYVNLVPRETVVHESMACPQCGALYGANVDKTVKLDTFDEPPGVDKPAEDDKKRFHFHTDKQ